jgi:hypothetical protein
VECVTPLEGSVAALVLWVAEVLEPGVWLELELALIRLVSQELSLRLLGFVYL